DQFCTRRLAQLGSGALNRNFPIADAPDPPMFRASSPRRFVPRFALHEIRVLHKTPVKIDHVKRAVRSRRVINPVKPWIARSEKLRLSFSAARHKRHAIR